MTSDERVKQMPSVPTIAEGGVPGYEFTAWIGAFVPARTPQTIVKRLNAELKKVLDDSETARKLSDQTLDPMYMTPAQFEKRLKSDYEKYGKVVQASGAKVE